MSGIGADTGDSPRPPSEDTRPESGRANRESAGAADFRASCEDGFDQTELVVKAALSRSFGGYVVERPLGHGGMGDVYLARKRGDLVDRFVVLKTVRKDLRGTSSVIERFRREAKLLAELDSPHFCRFYDSGSEGGAPYLVMEFVDGRPLHDVAERGSCGSPGNPNWLVAPFIDLALALHEAHERGLVHRDIKPANIIRKPNGSLVLLDFGVAHEPSENPLTSPGQQPGTFEYMAPEQRAGRAVDRRTDVFALGAVLYEQLTGSRLHADQGQGRVPEAAVRNRAVPPRLSRVVARAMMEDPRNRYPSAAAFANDLARVLDGRRPAFRWYRRMNRAATAVAAAVVATAAVAWLVDIASSADRAVPVEPRPLTSRPGNETAPAIGPRGRRVAYAFSPPRTVDDERPNRRIVVLDLATGAETEVTTGTFDDSRPSWSPDGSCLAFARDGRALWLARGLDQPGAGVRLRSLGLIVEPPSAWIGGGKSHRIAFIERAGAARWLSVMDVDTGRRWQLAPVDAPGYTVSRYLSASPDGRSLVLSQGFELALVRLENGPVPRCSRIESLLEFDGLFGVTWIQPQRLVYLAGRGAQRRAYLYDLAGGRLQTLQGLHEFAGDLSATVAEDGTAARIVYSNHPAPIELGLLALRPDGSLADQPRPLCPSHRMSLAARFAPDGKRIVFASDRSGTLSLYVSTLADGELRRITDDAAADGAPAWSPDGHSIVFDRAVPGAHQDLFVVDPNVGPRSMRRLTFTPDSAEVRPSWSADGDALYFCRVAPGKTPRLMRMSYVDGAVGAAVPVVSGEGFEARETPDGQLLYYCKRQRPGLWRKPRNGRGPVEQVSTSVTQGRWTVTSTGVWFVDLEDAKAIKVFSHDNPQTVRVVGQARQDLNPWVNGFDVHPDVGCIVLRDPTDDQADLYEVTLR